MSTETEIPFCISGFDRFPRENGKKNGKKTEIRFGFLDLFGPRVDIKKDGWEGCGQSDNLSGSRYGILKIKIQTVVDDVSQWNVLRSVLDTPEFRTQRNARSTPRKISLHPSGSGGRACHEPPEAHAEE